MNERCPILSPLQAKAIHFLKHERTYEEMKAFLEEEDDQFLNKFLHSMVKESFITFEDEGTFQATRFGLKKLEEAIDFFNQLK